MKRRPTLKITSRTSSITNSFVQAIVPSVPATASEIDEALSHLGMSLANLQCAYCGGAATDWDHLRPLVRKQRPTGYIDDVRNRVPSCNRCNQSKSGADWKQWMLGNASGSPGRRGVLDLKERVARLEDFERWGNVVPLSLAELVGLENWDAHWARHDAIVASMRDAQAFAEQIKRAIVMALDPTGMAKRSKVG